MKHNREIKQFLIPCQPVCLFTRLSNQNEIFYAEEKLSAEIIKGVKDVTIDQVVDHIAHIVDVGSIDCVGLGSDFDGIPATPVGLSDTSCFPGLIQGLLDHGYSHEDVQKIMGENLKDFLIKYDR